MAGRQSGSVGKDYKMTTPTVIAPPFTPERVALAYSPDLEWRNRTEFIRGRDEIRAFLRRKWAKELDYRLRKTLWGFRGNRMAVSFEYEWHDHSGQWYRSYGIELWECNEGGLMQRRLASVNDLSIERSERRN